MSTPFQDLCTQDPDEPDMIENFLLNAADKDFVFDWKSLLDNSKYKVKKPEQPLPLEYPQKLPPLSEKPNNDDPIYKPSFSMFDLLIPKRKRNKIEAYKKKYEDDIAKWIAISKERDIELAKAEVEKQNIDKTNAESVGKYRAMLIEWQQNKDQFIAEQKLQNQKIQELEQDYLEGKEDAIATYCELVLDIPILPKFFQSDYELEYHIDNKTLYLDYLLPSTDDIPTLKEVKYIKSKDELRETNLSDSVRNKLYDSAVYQITLLTIFRLFQSDYIQALDSIIFNGWVETIDKATGNYIKPCILTVQTSRDEFLCLNLSNVEPKACFKKLKGIGSSKLSSITPVPPLATINKDDRRFVNPYDVAKLLDSSVNLAAMDWLDFEHLIRELFEKEFTKDGGEVKITRASRDGGVDAVAFDPDPLRGGKIVIQAKRYTNTVGVSAVRDLYGTVLNEGATKGILVSTSDYGPDAYEFAKDKPLTLLNGGNLLHLLANHGYKAKIDMIEAKKIIAERK